MIKNQRDIVATKLLYEANENSDFNFSQQEETIASLVSDK